MLLAAPTMPAKKTPKKQSKFAFIRSQPATLSATEVVAKAKALGMKFDVTYVHKARRTAKSKKAAAKKTSTVKPMAPAASKSSTPSKSDLIRKQPATLSAAEVVAKAKAAGIGGGSKAMKGTVKKTSTKPTVTSKTPAKVSKSDFVRSRADLSPKEIVEDAKAAGIKFDVGSVYNVRGYDNGNGKGKKKPVKARTTPRKFAPVPRPITTTSSAENLLKALGAEIGLGRAIEILAGERARVAAVLRG